MIFDTFSHSNDIFKWRDYVKRQRKELIHKKGDSMNL